MADVTFETRGMCLVVTDVGGSRSERGKWIECFNDVNAILFVASLTDYDDFRIDYSNPACICCSDGDQQPGSWSNNVTLNLRHDSRGRLTRMDESLALFALICKSTFFEDTSIMLFLNKIDVFAKRIKHSPLSDQFSEEYLTKYDDDICTACGFILTKYNNTTNTFGKGQELYCHFSCAIGALGNTQFILDAVTDMIIKTQLQNIGLF